MSILKGTFVPQDRFPREDVTAGNADFLSLLLASPDMRSSSHDRAERVWLYRMGHPALVQACQYLGDQARIGAVSHGITTYESLATLLRQTTDVEDALSAGHVGPVGVNVHGLDELLTLLESSKDGFAVMPNTAAVVAETAEYAYPGLGEFAVYGAALAWGLELEVV